MISRKSTPTRNHHHRRNTEEEEEVEEEDGMKCTGKACKSCAAHCIADCVAICCCPCAVINILAFAFLKVPWTVGKRILKHEKNKKKKRKRDKIINHHHHPVDHPMELDGRISRSEERVEKGKGTPGFEFSGEVDESLKHSSSSISRYEEEELFFELCQDFSLGFGRVSLSSDDSSNCNSN